MLTRKVIKVSASQIPSGTAYLLASFEKNLEYTLNRVRLDKGAAKIVRAAGDQEFRGVIEVRSSPGSRAIVDPGPQNNHFDIWSPQSGTRLSREKALFKEYYRYSRHSFSPQERYLAFTWQKIDKAEILPRVGIGIYDCVSQRIWEQANAVFAVWSVRGDSLIFADWGPSGVKSVNDLRFFRKNTTGPAADPIAPGVVERLVGKWYFPRLKRALASQSISSFSDFDLANITGHNSIAPGNRGAILTECRRRNYDPDLPTYPYDQDLEWTTTYLDARGRSAVYEPSPPLFPIVSWSRDGERLYGITRSSFSFRAEREDLICFWVRSGKYATVPFASTLGTLLAYVEN